MNSAPQTNLMESASRPNSSCARVRIAAMSATAFSGWLPGMKTASAYLAANRRPEADVPAWKSSGVRCGEGGTGSAPSERK